MDPTMNDENTCPNTIPIDRRTRMAKLFHERNARVDQRDAKQLIHISRQQHYVNSTDDPTSHIIVNTTKKEITNINEITLRETRRKIMLQERRMEKALILASPKVITVEPISCEYATESSFSKEETQRENEVHTKESLTRITRDDCPSKQDGDNNMSMVSHLLLLLLALYQVQLHDGYMSHSISWSIRRIQYYINEWIGNHPIVSGNVLMFLLIMELHQKTMGYYLESEMSWEEILHVTFVGVFLVRGFIIAFGRAQAYFVEHDGARLWKGTLVFLVTTVCWIIVLPLYNKCDSESKYCFFINSSTSSIISSPRYSWLDISIVQCYKSISRALKSKIKGRLFKEARRAFVNPFRFHDRLKKLFTILRWAKFLAPLIGTCNKLRGHVLDMLKKKGQHLSSKTARKMWSDLMEAWTCQTKQEKAVLQLQKSFRERRERKAKRRMELISSQQRPSAHFIRKRLRMERDWSKSKLIKMEMRNGERQLRRQVSEQERVEIDKHMESRRRQKKKLLLSPKTAFAVGWKYVAIGCVILEVSQMVFAPLLSGELKKMPLDKFLSVVLFASCNEQKKTNQLCISSAWKHHWWMAVHVVSRVLVPFVHAVCFLDVFVTFSTGELTAAGKLEPKPFVERFIFPGIGLQLIVNPTMVAISKLVKRAIVHSMHVGPSLYFHLILVCLPLIHWVFDRLLDVVIEFVDRQNKILSSRSFNIF